MKAFTLVAFTAALILSSCGGESKKAAESAKAEEVAKRADPPPPTDEARRFPKENLIDSDVVHERLMGRKFMPGGTVARYKKGKTEYQMFLAKAASASDAAIMLSDWRQSLTNPKLVPSFGGYFGQDNGKPLFVFTKNDWILGVKGLSEGEADLAGRNLAARIQ